MLSDYDGLNTLVVTRKPLPPLKPKPLSHRFEMSPTELKLVSPAVAYQKAFQNYVLDYVRNREAFWIDYYGHALRDFSSYLIRLANASQETWWGVLSRKRLMGVSRLRTGLDAYTYNYLGHIGFDVAPSQRGQGYAT